MKSLLRYNTFGIDNACKEIYEPASINELLDIMPILRQEPLLVVGGGSNLLLTKDFEGNVLHVSIKGIDVINAEDGVYLRCGAGEVWDDIVAFAVDNGFYGMENLSLIPGEVGASAVQNIGAYGKEAKDVISKVEAVEIATGNLCSFTPAECQYAYRYSRFKGEWKDQYVITHVTYHLSKTFVPLLDYGNLRGVLGIGDTDQQHVTASDVRRAIIEIRNSKLPDPKIEGNAGSFFMNPVVAREKFVALQKEYPAMPHYYVDENHEKIPAGWMIEQSGWKGKCLGRAGVHDKQALVLVNKGGATGQEIVTLCNTIRTDVFNRFGVMIYPEVNII